MAATGSFISLFSGCGGLDLAFESLGWTCVAQVENDKDCVAVLKQRFPGIPNLGDITEVDWSQAPPAEGIIGGFPCQDMSYAGRGAGLEGDRSGLWFPMMDAIRAVRPQRVVVENVPGLLSRGLHVVTHDLARAGYVGTWRTLAAADMGAPHRRERVFVVARLKDATVAVAGQAFLLGDFTEDGWTSPQETLLGAELLDRLPKAGAWTRERIYEFELADTEDEILLLPSPAAYESTPTDEFIEEMRRAGIQPDARLYLPGRKWFAQRTLSRVAAALLPTPNAWLGRRPENATADPERAKSREQDGIRGKRSIELPDALADGVKILLPTPTTQDGENCGGPSQHDRNTPPLNAEVTKLLPTPTAGDGKSAGSRNLEGSNAHPGVSLTDAIQFGDSSTPRLLPTPTVADAEGGRTSKGKERPDEHGLAVEMKLLPTPNASDGPKGGPNRRDGKGSAYLSGVQRLLPTPVANPENPGAGGELRAAIHHGPERRTDSDTDTLGRPIRKGRLLPTPQKSDGDGGRLDRNPETVETGRRPSGSKVGVPLASALDRDVTLLPTPRVEASRSSRKSLVENQQWSAPSLEQAVEIAQGILPREFDSWDQVKGKDHPSEGAAAVEWGDYEPAIRRWEAILGRPAPLPTDAKGRLSPAFVEWMLGFPEDWVHIDGAKRTAQLRMLGNAVQVQCGQVVALWLAELGELS